MRNMIKPTIALFFICFGVAICLALINYLTRDSIVQRTKIESEEQKKQVMHEAKKFNEVEKWKEKDESDIIREAYSAYDGEKFIGYVFSAFPKGYGGEIKVTVGIYNDRRVSGVRLGANNETPGLGTKASEDGFINQYIGKSVQNTLQVVKRAPVADNEIQAISGATITSRAVTSAVQASLELADKLIK